MMDDAHGRGHESRRRFSANEVPRTVAQACAMVPRRAGSYTAGGRNGHARMSGDGTPKAWASPVPKFSPNRPAAADAVAGSGGSFHIDMDSELRRPDVILASQSRSRSKFEVEQLVMSPGTLPAPMTQHERERVIRKLLPTATHEMLAKIPAGLLETADAETQMLRRKLAHGSTVVFFTAGYPGKRFVFERAFNLGIKSVVIEHPDSWARALLDEGLIAKFIPIDMGRSSDEIFSEALERVRELGHDGVTGEADAVCTVVELSMPMVARLCEELGLPGPPASAVDAARSKHATRRALEAAGLPTPRNFIIRSQSEVEAAAEHVGFPAVLKPISGAASLGVKKVVAKEDLLLCYKEVVAELSSLVVISGALEVASASGKGVKANSVVDMSVLLEQYLDGHEVDVDVVVSDGKWRYAAITDNGPTLEPYFNETWGVCPSVLPVQSQRELKELAVQCVAALGFSSGVFHVECKLTSTGPQLIEVNARMGGGPVHQVNLLTWGVDLVEEVIFISLGIPSRPVVPDKPLKCLAYYLVPAHTSGTVANLPDVEQILGKPGVEWARNLVQPGDRVVGPAEGFPAWVLDLGVTSSTAQGALDYVWQLEAENRISLQENV